LTIPTRSRPLEAAAQWPTQDQSGLRSALEARLKDWRGLFGRNVGHTRQLLRKLLVGKLTITPEVTETGRFSKITGTGTLEPLARGLCPSMVASPRGLFPFTVVGSVV